MNIVLSWSKPTSRVVASSLHEWLPKVLPGAEPWMSDKDITKGSVWFSSLQDALNKAHSCIICVTPENLESKWLYFEAGSFFGKGLDAKICCYLAGVEPAALADTPLSHFQHTLATKDDTRRLIHTLNNLSGSAHNVNLIDGNFDHRWSELEPSLAAPLVSPVPKIREAGILVSADAKSLLLEAANDKNGKIYNNKNAHEVTIKTNERNFVERNSPRSEARWRSALQELESANLIEPFNQKREVYRVTQRGYDLAEKLESDQKIPPPAESQDSTSKQSVPDRLARVIEYLEEGIGDMAAHNCSPEIHRLFNLAQQRLNEIYAESVAQGIAMGHLAEAIREVEKASTSSTRQVLQSLDSLKWQANHAIKMLKEHHRFLTLDA